MMIVSGDIYDPEMKSDQLTSASELCGNSNTSEIFNLALKTKIKEPANIETVG